jgi:PIN domain nuclease of toxin-antitoxin system
VFVSIVTCWEISIKLGLGKLKLEMPLEDLFAFERQAMNLLEVTLDDVSAYATLGFPVQDHRDPFDRLLAVQAQERGLKLVTADPVFSGYLPHDLLVIN